MKKSLHRNIRIRLLRTSVFSAVACALALTMLNAAAQTCLPPANGNWAQWLGQQESAGGHAVRCHVGKSESGLIGRIINRGGGKGDTCAPYPEAASSFTDAKTMLRAISDAIKTSAPGAVTGPNGRTTLTGRSEQKVGLVVKTFTGKDPSKNRSPCNANKGFVCQGTRNWVAVIEKNDADCFLLTAYPK
ncbi:RNase A-like domain-containing protein [Burkholderia sp. JPY481]